VDWISAGLSSAEISRLLGFLDFLASMTKDGTDATCLSSTKSWKVKMGLFFWREIQQHAISNEILVENGLPILWVIIIPNK
jgi:hypothetical protein